MAVHLSPLQFLLLLSPASGITAVDMAAHVRPSVIPLVANTASIEIPGTTEAMDMESLLIAVTTDPNPIYFYPGYL